MNYIGFTFLLLTITSLSAFTAESDLYQEMLDKHSNSGHFTQDELQEQQFKYSNQKRWQKSFSRQVRSVASTIDESRDVIRLKNEEIEISVK
jgi:hypothetical protein